MKDHEVEQALRDWIEADARAPEPARLRDRVLAVPEDARVRTGRWWPRLLDALRTRPLSTMTVAVAMMLLVALALLPVSRLAIDGETLVGGPASLVVSPDGSGDFGTIGAAVEAAADGDTVLVGPGTYVESIYVDKDITLRGEGDRDQIVITSPAGAPIRLLPWREQPFGIQLDGATTTLENVTLRGLGSSLIVLGGSSRVQDVAFIDGSGTSRIEAGDIGWPAVTVGEGATVEIADSYFRHSNLLFDPASDATLENNELEASMVTLGGNCCGAAFRATPITEDSGSLIRGNAFVDPWIGIWLDSFGNARIEGNEFIGAANIGVRVARAGPDNVIERNGFRDGKTAILIYGGHKLSGDPVDVLANELADNEVGLNIGGVGSTVRGNDIRGNRLGVLVSDVEGGTSPTLEENTVEDNERGISITGAATPILRGNVICSNEMNLRLVGDPNPTLEDNEICADEAAVSAQ